jgi:hypothetical protein
VVCFATYPRLGLEFGVDVVPVGRWGKGTGRGALSLLRRSVPLLCNKLHWRQCAEPRVWPQIGRRGGIADRPNLYPLS